MQAQKNALKSKKPVRLLIVVFFVAVLIIGLCIYDDYGISVDEPLQRQHSLINYEYVNETLFGREIPYIKDQGFPPLKDYVYNYYNMAVQLPLVAMEDTTGFTMTTHDIFLMRHLYTFLIYFFSLILFFFLLKDLLKKEWLALVGTAMLYLFPRFFAESFYNIKDLMFIAMFIIALFCLVKVLKNRRRLGWCVLFAVVCAIATNTRFIGAMLLPALLLFMLIEDLFGRFSRNPEIQAALCLPEYKGKLALPRRILPYIVICAGFVLTYVAITPASWDDPAVYMKDTFLKFADYNDWNSGWVFAGQLVTLDTRPWYYIPVWMGITIPLFYLAMFGAGVVFLIFGIIKKGVEGIIKERKLLLVFALFLAPLLAGMILHITIYIGWKHVYFLFIPFLIIAVYGLGMLQAKMKESKTKLGRRIVPIVTAAALAVGAGRVIANHPYQNTMFNLAGIFVADQYDRDYWALTYRDMIVHLLDTNEGVIKVNSGTLPSITENILTDEQKKRVEFMDPGLYGATDYVLYNFRYDAGNDYALPGFTEVYAIWQDGYKIGTVLKNNSGISISGISPAAATTVDSDRFTVQVSGVTDLNGQGIENIYFEVYDWGAGPDSGATFFATEMADGSYEAEVYTGDLSSPTGLFQTDIYGTDNKGNVSYLGYTRIRIS